jgi:hypothetical protein
MMLRKENLEPFERYSGYVQTLCPELGFGFLQIDNSGCCPSIYFSQFVCESFKFENVKLGERFRFNVRPSKTYPDKLCATRMRREAASMHHIDMNRQNEDTSKTETNKNLEVKEG